MGESDSDLKSRLAVAEERVRVLTERMKTVEGRLWAIALAVLLAVAKSLLGVIGL